VWNVWEPGQRSCFGCRECCEAPVEGGGHVPCGREMAAAGGFLQVAEWMLAGLGGEVDQVSRSVGQAGSSVRPGTCLSTRSGSAKVRDPTSCSAAFPKPLSSVNGPDELRPGGTH
jgi:hypothetical protein